MEPSRLDLFVSFPRGPPFGEAFEQRHFQDLALSSSGLIVLHDRVVDVLLSRRFLFAHPASAHSQRVCADLHLKPTQKAMQLSVDLLMHGFPAQEFIQAATWPSGVRIHCFSASSSSEVDDVEGAFSFFLCFLSFRSPSPSPSLFRFWSSASTT